MKSSLLKTPEFGLSFTLAFLFFCYCYSLSWPSSFRVFVLPPSGEVSVELENQFGDVKTKTIKVSATSPLKFGESKLRAISSANPAHQFVVVHEHMAYLDPNLIPEFSDRNTLLVMRSLILVSLTLFFMLFIISRWIQSADLRFDVLPTTLVFFSHFLFLELFFYYHRPGFYNFDSFRNLMDAATHSLSVFHGYFYSGFVMVFYHLFPSESLVGHLTIFVISLTLAFLFRFSYRENLVKIYLVSCGLLYVLPINLVMALINGRDPVANWILGLTLVYFYLCFKNLPDSSLLTLFFLSYTTCLLRPEMKLLIPAALVLFAWRYGKLNRKFVITTLMIFPVVYAVNKRTFSLSPDHEQWHYETTLLVNPVGSILKKLYPEGLPEEVKRNFGNYFKMDYITRYHDIADIYPFHKGGVNLESTYEDYKKFRKASIDLISQHPLLFLKNRLEMAYLMSGLKQNIWFASDEYSDATHPFMQEARAFLDLPPHPHVRGPFLDLAFSGNIFIRSYLIPLFLLPLLAFLLPLRSPLLGIFLILVARTLIVILTSPATYFKYNYILWLMSILVLPLWVYEWRSLPRKLTFAALFKKIGSLRLLDKSDGCA